MLILFLCDSRANDYGEGVSPLCRVHASDPADIRSSLSFLNSPCLFAFLIACEHRAEQRCTAQQAAQKQRMPSFC